MYASNDAAPATDWRNFRASQNFDKGGIEIRFPTTPPDDLREQLGPKRGQGFRFTASNNDPRWYAPNTEGCWLWVQRLVEQNAPYGAAIAAPTTAAPASGQTPSNSRSRWGGKKRDRNSQSSTSKVTAFRQPTPTVVSATVSASPTKAPPTPSPDMNLNDLMSLIGDPDDLLAWAESLIANDWRVNLKGLAAARCPNPLSFRFAFGQCYAEAEFTIAAMQLAQLREAMQMAQAAKQVQPLPTAPPPTIAPPPPDIQTPPAVVEADQAKKALRGKPRFHFVFSSRNVRSSPSPSATPAVTPRATANTKQARPDVAPTPVTVKPSVSNASPARITEKPSVIGQYVILDDDVLTETERYVGCYAVLDGKLGLSFKGLQAPIKFQVQGLAAPYEAQPGTFQPLKASRALVKRMQALIWVWQNWQQLIRLEQDRQTSDITLLARRADFKRVYDKCVATHGTIASNANLLLFEGMQDPRLTALRSLELDGQKAPIFFQRTHFPKRDLSSKRYDEVTDEHLAAALTLSLAEYGEVNLDAIAVWFGATPEPMEAALLESGLCCLEPVFEEGHGHRSFIRELDEEADFNPVNKIVGLKSAEKR